MLSRSPCDCPLRDGAGKPPAEPARQAQGSRHLLFMPVIAFQAPRWQFGSECRVPSLTCSVECRLGPACAAGEGAGVQRAGAAPGAEVLYAAGISHCVDGPHAMTDSSVRKRWACSHCEHRCPGLSRMCPGVALLVRGGLEVTLRTHACFHVDSRPTAFRGRLTTRMSGQGQ